MKRIPTSVRLSDEGKQLQRLLSERLAISQTAVIELALRKLADEYKVKKERQG